MLLAFALAACTGTRSTHPAAEEAAAGLGAGGSAGHAAPGGADGSAAAGNGGTGGAALSREACVDAWLKARGLNEFGDPPGTMYMGGTPLFDEATGERRDRIAYVVGKHPEIAHACP